ncbi:MAG: hypothetical protein NC097_00385 [Clostridium sp.]|nr:MFS transporter [Prevotella sp.]MCM1428239.1 hypothetical protein [Clostridium sp.]MCM1474723.1 MFS transporter [Muribaculaceae bacterium]
MTNSSKNEPWAWIPTLYIAEGLPYFAVNVLTVLLYVQMGISNEKMALYTGMLYLPWVVKPFWSPFVDLFSTKRIWSIAMQFLIAICMAGVVLVLSQSFFFTATLCLFWVMAFASATHDIAADGFYILALNKERQAAYVGLRSTCYRIASVLGQGGLVVLIGILQERYGYSIPSSWQCGFAILSITFFAIALWHSRFMPKPGDDRPSMSLSRSEIFNEFGQTFVTFFQRPHVWTAILFLLLYRLPEALCIKLVQPFLLAPHSEGGLALNMEQVGFANGTVGVIALLAGGIVGGLFISEGGLKKWLWPMAISLTLPCIFYCLLAMWLPENFWLIATAIGVEQFGYGFGFTAFMMYMMYFCQGKFSTSHYAFCTAFMAAGMMLPGMIAGWLWRILGNVHIFGVDTPQGYINFFWVVVACSLATFLSCRMVSRSLS